MKIFTEIIRVAIGDEYFIVDTGYFICNTFFYEFKFLSPAGLIQSKPKKILCLGSIKGYGVKSPSNPVMTPLLSVVVCMD
ncbi:hypothetical protein ES703_79237 [subsurface metagenome]